MNQTAPDAATIEDAFTRAINFCEVWSLDDLVTPCLAPHAPYSLDTKQLKLVKNVANDLGVKIQMHVAESQFEMQHLQKINQPSSIKYLDSIGLLDNQLLQLTAFILTETISSCLLNANVSFAQPDS